MNADVEKAVELCRQCGMACNAGEFHPYAACLMYEACHNAETVRANLDGVRDYALRDQEAEIDRLRAVVVRNAAITKSRLAAADALLRKCRDEFKSLPHSLGYDFTHLPELDAHLSENTHA